LESTLLDSFVFFSTFPAFIRNLFSNAIKWNVGRLCGMSCFLVYEEHFGKIRAQMVPCDQLNAAEDLTDELSARDSFASDQVEFACTWQGTG
jgi:hypothetical protein